MSRFEGKTSSCIDRLHCFAEFAPVDCQAVNLERKRAREDVQFQKQQAIFSRFNETTQVWLGLLSHEVVLHGRVNPGDGSCDGCHGVRKIKAQEGLPCCGVNGVGAKDSTAGGVSRHLRSAPLRRLVRFLESHRIDRESQLGACDECCRPK